MRHFITFFLILTGINALSQNNNLDTTRLSMDSLFRKKARESEGKPFPSFIASLDGHPLTKDSLIGKVVFMNFWFEACPPCIAELAALNDLYKKYSSNREFEFISFTYESPARIKELKRKYHIPYKVISISTQECYRLNQNNGFPTSIILDREGVIKHLFTGGSDQKKEAEFIIYNSVYDRLDETLRK